MEILVLKEELTVFQVEKLDSIKLTQKLLFIGITDEEISIVSPTTNVPEETINREDGWRGFKINGILDFSLIGILAKISGLLTQQSISIFAISTYNTDYILIKEDKLEDAINTLIQNKFIINLED